MNIPDGIKDRPFEFFCGIFLTLLGIALATTGTSWQIVAGSASAAVGGALITWSASNVKTRDRARQILQHEIEATARHLADVTAKLNRIVQEVDGNDLNAKQAITLISETPSSLYVIVNELQLLAGSKFQSEGLLHTVATSEEQLHEIFAELSKLPPKPGSDVEVEGILGRIHSVTKQLESAQREYAEPGRSYLIESVKCPSCDTEMQTAIGTNQGDSASPLCKTCKKRFHAHRAADGSIFSKPWGAPSR